MESTGVVKCMVSTATWTGALRYGLKKLRTEWCVSVCTESECVCVCVCLSVCVFSLFLTLLFAHLFAVL